MNSNMNKENDLKLTFFLGKNLRHPRPECTYKLRRDTE